MDYLKIQSTFMQHTKRVDYLFSMDYSPEKILFAIQPFKMV